MASLAGSTTPKTARFFTPSTHLVAKSASKVRVVLRIRPFLPSDIAAGDEIPIPCISKLDQDGESTDEVTVHIKDRETSRNECFKLDSFFGQGENVGLIFDKEVRPVIPGVFQGCNATVFAYGATGSGKTYTMQGTDEQPGLMLLAMSTILSMCENTGDSVEISYYEVYLDRCYDLLEPKAKEILILEDKDGRVQLKGLSKVPVCSMFEFHEVLFSGIQRRKVAHTGLNDVSSRSHGILMIGISSSSDGSAAAITGKLNLIDLAGNEDNRRTCNSGIRLQESAKINQSLFALSNVIYALNNNEPRVPYRESKLTRILQDSLGGSSRALMIACLNPVSYQEAVHTVSLAARSCHIINFISSAQKQGTPKVKVDMEEKLRAWLESKGKIKNAQRTGTPNSFLIKTAASINSSRKPNLSCSSAKKSGNNGVFNSKARKLFHSEAPIPAATEPSYSSNAPTIEDSILSNEEESFHREAESKHCSHITKDNDHSVNFKDENKEESFHQVGESKDCSDNTENDSLLVFKDEVYDQNTCSLHEFDQLKLEDMVHKTDDDKKNSREEENLTRPSCLADECLDKENMTARSYDVVWSPPVNKNIRELQNSLRKVLSPIHSNTSAASNDRIYLVLLDPQTPKTPPLINFEDKNFQVNGTPLDKFNARSSSLKSSLVEEYLAFLNAASKEELLALKGIGKKRAEYILQLREKSPQPLKSLSDLEKIGLSSKQVHYMFRSAAREIFTDVP